MTVNGNHTAAELQDLVNAKTYEVGQVAQAYADYSPTWVAKDSGTFVDFTNDWSNFQARWDKALKVAQSSLTLAKLNPAPSDVILAEKEYMGLLNALQPHPGIVDKGSFQDLYNRLVAAGKPVDVSKVPQPTAVDRDLQAYQASDTAVKGVQSAGEALKQAATSKYGLYVGLGLAGILGLLIITRR